MPTSEPTWSAPVRFAEVDKQGVVFNAHYLLYCDEAMGAFCDMRGLRAFAETVRLVSSTIIWTGSARWGDTVDVEAVATRIGTSSLSMTFDIAVRTQTICRVETVYVNIGPDDRTAPIPSGVRNRLTDAAQ